jgi:hypothetical protein
MAELYPLTEPYDQGLLDIGDCSSTITPATGAATSSAPGRSGRWAKFASR